ncbi:hypothetical protein [Streptomyces abyssalis]|uniref:hypothetical protein n=1 Tax=Streptomyces abyssalis TaxID=933944 RepID=UPI00085C5210|nr:hypothetical protein [Streptomyces abyssalis]
MPDQRTGAEVAEDRLASLLDSLVSEQTAALHALGAARTGTVIGDARAELPGEAAAVEAFLAAHPRVDADHRGTVDISAGPTGSETVVGRRAVREGRGSRGRRRGGARRTSLVGRPLRAGFAMAVAGCALGGVAVAAGAGVLPSPFGGSDTPATSVSPMASPDGEAAAGGSGSPYDGPRRGTREGGSPSDSPSGEDLAGKERGRDGKNSKAPPGDEDWWHGDGKGLSPSDKKAMARALCNAYENDDLSVNDRLRLELVAGGPAGVKKFCDKHDSGRDENTSSGGGPGGIGTPGDPGGDSGGDSSGNGGDDGDDGGGPGGDDGGGGPGGDDGGDNGGGSGGGDSGGDGDGGDGDGGGGGGGRPDSGGAGEDPDVPSTGSQSPEPSAPDGSGDAADGATAS